jgi:VanZ family protein
LSKCHYLWTWLFLIFSGVLLYSLFRPTSPPDVFANSDKVGHVLIFFAVSLSGRLSKVAIPDRLHWPLWTFLAMALEYLQGAARPLRIFSIEDAYANVAGVLLGLLGWLVIRLYLARFPKGAGTNVLE